MEQKAIITDFKTIQEKAAGVIVQLSEFDDGTPLVVRLRRPSIMGMVFDGKIPNELIEHAVEMVDVKKQTEKADDKFNSERMQKTYRYMHLIAKECLVEPTYDELIEAGYTLNDDQLASILLFSQVGIKAVKPFRAK